MVYVDNARNERHGREWSHLVADSLEELHQFAVQQRLPRSWFHAAAKYPHYDVTQWGRHRALEGGAKAVARRDLLLKARALREQSLVPARVSGTVPAIPGLFD